MCIRDRPECNLYNRVIDRVFKLLTYRYLKGHGANHVFICCIQQTFYRIHYPVESGNQLQAGSLLSCSWFTCMLCSHNSSLVFTGVHFSLKNNSYSLSSTHRSVFSSQSTIETTYTYLWKCCTDVLD